jgi:hypothetical protein
LARHPRAASLPDAYPGGSSLVVCGTGSSIWLGRTRHKQLTYIGNAPNFIVYAIPQEHGIKMPNFFGYMLWAAVVLVSLFALLTLLPIAPILEMLA